MNVDEMKKYLDRNGVTKSGFKPGQSTKIVKAKTKTAPVVKLKDLKAEPVADKVIDTTEDFVVTEITPTQTAA
jgi:hypothetical protein